MPADIDGPDDVLSLLRTLTGRAEAEFRPHQREAIAALVEGRRVLLVERTGWGKSAVYFLATRLLRQAGMGPTLLISPLLALMRNQLEAAARLGIAAETINSTNPDDFERVRARIAADEVDLLVVSPERLANPNFLAQFEPLIARLPGLVVVDEAHCISDWGHDFRPDYRRIARLLDRLVGGVPVVACTATANARVVADVAHQLGTDALVFRGPLGRDGLGLHVVELPDPARRLAWLAAHVPTLPGSGIIYCLTIDDTRVVAAYLQSEGVDVAAYSGDTADDERLRLEAALLAGEVKALAATSALGMGFDKPDLGFVIHYQSPGSPIAYYQQVGRAGRAVTPSYAVLLRGREDRAIQDFFIEVAFPPEPLVRDVLAAFDEVDGPVRASELVTRVNLRPSRVDVLLKQLEVDGVLHRVTGTAYERTPAPFVYPAERVDAVRAFRRAEQAEMDTYATGGGCRMAFLQRALDDPTEAPCGLCDRCAGARFDAAVDQDRLITATRFLRGRSLVIEPRKQWPAGLSAVRGRIGTEERLAEGRALGRRGDGVWAPLVERGRCTGEPFGDELVDGLAELVRRWRPTPAPTWVTCVPSRRRPELVPDLAARLADHLALPFRPVAVQHRATSPQEHQQNSARQVMNVVDAYAITGSVPPDPVLLVDDLVDSGWTLTVVGRLLRGAGSGLVHPLAAIKGAG